MMQGAAGGGAAQQGQPQTETGSSAAVLTEEERFIKAQEKFQAGSKPSAAAGSAGAVKKTNSFAALNNSDSEDE